MSTLLIDGVKYEEWTPASEDEFERMGKEHAKDIFGEQSIYLDIKHKLKSKSGIGSIPDGYVIVFGEQPDWYIVEVELSSHPLYDHIVPQVGKFISGIRNPSTQKEIVDALFHEIDSDEFLRLRLRKAIGATETYKFLADLVSKSPVVIIIIEKHTGQLDEAIEALRHPQIKIVEFQTFTREGVGLGVHAHLFEPLYEAPLKKQATVEPAKISPEGELSIIVKPAYLKYKYIPIFRECRSWFPGFKVPFGLETDRGTFQVDITDAYPSRWQQGDMNSTAEMRGLGKWFQEHRGDLKLGDNLVIEVIEPMKRYRLKIA
jgi:hypothetical protein